METTAAAALLECAAGMSQVGRARIFGGWVPANTWAALVILSGSCAQTRSVATRVRAPVASCWGHWRRAWVSVSSSQSVLEVSSRVGGEGVSEGDGRGLILRHGGWMDGWMSRSL